MEAEEKEEKEEDDRSKKERKGGINKEPEGRKKEEKAE